MIPTTPGDPTSAPAKKTAPVLLVRWEAFVDALFERTQGFPKHLRHTLTNRLETLALEIYEGLQKARFHPEPWEILEEQNQRLGMLRLLLRLCWKRGCLPEAVLLSWNETLDEIGRMLGGWQKKEAAVEKGRGKGAG